MGQGFLNPVVVLKKLKLSRDLTAADFGCGSGSWVIPLAKKLEEGKVYAIDILEEALSALKSKLKIEKISNVETVKGDIEKGTRILSGTCDLVLMTNLLFELENKEAVFKEGVRVLRNKGRILIVDWKENSPFGPENKVSIDEIKKLAEDLGLKLEKKFDAGMYHYGLVFTK